MAPDANEALGFTDLTLGYNSHPAVHHLSGSLKRGSLTAIIGANGSGKSTLMKAMIGMLKPMSGSVARAPGQTIAYLPQQTELDRHFPARVIDLVSLGLWNRRGLLGRHGREDKERVQEAIDTVGLSGFEHRVLGTLSGGQLQRALFARVLVQDADLILLDEPFNAIDTRTLTDLIVLIGRWHAEGRTIAVVVHDHALVRAHFPESLLLARELVAWGDTAEVLSAGNLDRASHFRETWDENAPWCDLDATDLPAWRGHDGHDDARAGHEAQRHRA